VARITDAVARAVKVLFELKVKRDMGGYPLLAGDWNSYDWEWIVVKLNWLLEPERLDQ
jgi:hypothetical protein